MSGRRGCLGWAWTIPCLAVVTAGLMLVSACSSVKSGSAASGSSGGSGTSSSNTLSISVNPGPVSNSLNTAFASVQICVHGTTTCQTIPDVLVDTGSTGLRLLGSEVSISLTAETDTSGNPLGECVEFADLSFAFGSVNVADITLAGETASSVPVQIVSPSGFPAAPASCNTGGKQLDSQTTLRANGILGVGLFLQDCGSACATAPPPVNAYYSCIQQVCNPVTVATANQLQNPVALFSSNNNGVLISLPSVGSSGVATVTGSLIFGIGTQSNNALGTAKVYTTSPGGEFTATYNSTAYPESFVDSGSNLFFFLDMPTTGMNTCVIGTTTFYCPNSTTNFTMTTMGLNATSGTVMFSIASASALFTANPSFAAFGNIGAPFAGTVDFGLPFFYGRPVFTAIENATTPGGTGPYFAF